MLSVNTTVDAKLMLNICVKIHILVVAELLNLRQDFKPHLDLADQSLRKVTLGVILDL